MKPAEGIAPALEGSRLKSLALSFFTFLSIALLDLATPERFSFSLFYLVPISLFLWFLGRGWAWWCAAASAFLWAASHLARGDLPYFRALVSYWEAASRLGLYAVFIICLGIIKRYLGQLRSMNDELRTALAAQRESEQRYREVFEYSSSGIILLDVTEDQQFKVVTINPRLERTMGVPAARIAGKFLNEVMLPKAADALTASCRQCVRAGGPISVDNSVELPAGHVTFHTAVIPIRDASGRIHRLIALSSDTTEARRAEEARRESEQRYREVFENTSDGIFMLDVTSDRRFRVVTYNPAMERMVGLTNDQVVGRYNEEFLTAETAAAVAKNNNACLRAGKPISFEEQIDLPGGPFTWNTTLVPVRDARGEIYRLLGVARDITENVRIRRALQQSDARYREIFETTSDGIFVIEVVPGPRYRFLGMNPAHEAMLGISAEDALGRFNDEVLPREIAEHVNENNRRCIVAGRPISFEDSLDLPRGRCYFMTTLVPVRDDAGRIVRLIGMARDFTERVRAAEREREHERQMFQAAKLASLGTLVAGIAHEINNPNNFIRLNSQNLQEFWIDIRRLLDQKAGTESDLAIHGIPYETARQMVEDLLAGIGEGSKRIEKLLINLRDFARGDEGDLTEDVNVNEVIDSAVMMAREMIQKSTSSFSVRETPGVPPIRGNYHQIEQVVINLLTNACQALPSRDRRITVASSLDEGGESITLEVIDEGVGMRPPDVSRVTDPFFTTKRARGGSGLGLAVSSRIVSNHRGTMKFESQVDRGTRVLVRLPVAGTGSAA